MDQRIWDAGKSESHSVIEWIRATMMKEIVVEDTQFERMQTSSRSEREKDFLKTHDHYIVVVHLRLYTTIRKGEGRR